ncbi:MAG: uridine kinase [Clostridia bacterium]|nr:uridine kinase [Clostridia bacterium]
MKNKDNLIIGICGGTGSGKTTLANRIAEAFGDDSLLISMDSYYKDHPEMTYDERAKINYDHPDAFDMKLLCSHLESLKRGKGIMCPTYDFTTHLRREEWLHVESRPVIIIEGILLFACPELADVLDIKVFVDADADVRILRRLVRDVKERGRNIDSVVSQYLTTVKPMHEAYIEPFKRLADVVVQDGRNPIVSTMLIDTIERYTSETRD